MGVAFHGDAAGSRWFDRAVSRLVFSRACENCDRRLIALFLVGTSVEHCGAKKRRRVPVAAVSDASDLLAPFQEIPEPERKLHGPARRINRAFEADRLPRPSRPRSACGRG